MIDPVTMERLQMLAESYRHNAPGGPIAINAEVLTRVLFELAEQGNRIERSLAELRDTLMLPEPRGLHYEIDSLPAILRKQAQ